MPTLRRYLRVSKYTVLECRLWLANPADSAWLNADATLDRIFTAVKPFIRPRLEEARATRGKKTKVARDHVSGDDFDVSVFLTKTGTFHSILYKSRRMDPDAPPLVGNTTRLTDAASSPPPVIRVESDDEDGPGLGDVPEAPPTAVGAEEDPLFLPGVGSDLGSDSDDAAEPARPSKRARVAPDSVEVELEIPDLPEPDDKKALHIDYEGFAIYNRVLCLIVTRTGKPEGGKGKGTGTATGTQGGGSQSEAGRGATVIEEWLQMSQATVGG
ncbi:hypothetical protein EDC01DRAFT_686997, partial [Geopyxis carbonaria]